MTIFISRVPHNGMINISGYINGRGVTRSYIGYSERAALQAFRAEFNLKYKHLDIYKW